MFSALTAKLEAVFRRIAGRGRLSIKDVESALREIRLALLEADVHVSVVKDLLVQVKERACGAEVLESLTPAQQVVKIVREELSSLLGGGPVALPVAESPPTVWMLVGLQGSGKTTTAAKLALRLKREGRSPVLVAADPYRPAAAEQLRILGGELEVPVLGKDGGEPPEVCREAVSEAARRGFDVVLLDTAGRLHIDDAMMGELMDVQKEVSPHATILVADAMSGQDAVVVAGKFHEALSLDGVILTKLDGDARGGAALSMRSVAGTPIVYVGVGEKLDAMEAFHPERMTGRILGMGDVLSLIERAEAAQEAERAAEAQKKLLKDAFTLEDFRDQLVSLRKMGSLEDIFAMMPGAGKLKKSLGGLPEERELGKVEAIINSMTRAERAHPRIIDGGRRSRIARGSGTNVNDVNRVLKHFNQMKSMMKNIQQIEKQSRRRGLPSIPWIKQSL
jgi:signal recognition particle subunit SRP54